MILSPTLVAALPPTVAATDLIGTRWLDLVGLGLVLFFVVAGIRGGLWWQLVRLLGLIATVTVARALAPHLGDALADMFSGLEPRIAAGLGWALVLGAGLLLVAMVARIGNKEGETPPELGWVDRTGGAVAGALSGIVLHAALLLCLAHFATPEWARATVRGSHSQQFVATLGRGIPGLVDAHAAESLDLPSASTDDR